MTEMEVDTTRTLELCYEFDGMHSVPVTFYPNTMIGKLIEYMKIRVNSSDIALYYDGVKLDGDKTMRDYNIPTGAKLTVKKFFTLPPSSPSPEPEGMQKDPMHSPRMAKKIEEKEKITVKVMYGWETDEPKLEHKIAFFADTSVKTLLRRFGTKLKKDGLAFFQGDVKLNEANTFAECNIPAGAILTVRQAPDTKRKREENPPPEAGDMQKTHASSPKLKGASMKAPEKSKTPPLPK
jgi:hypothetical protein